MNKNSFKCPECGGDSSSGGACVSPPPYDPAEPWTGIHSITRCDSCDYDIPDHLGERWDDISYEQAVKEWKEVYRDTNDEE